MTRSLPSSASIATPIEGQKLHAPSAERNSAAICDLLAHVGPQPGAALELASGTGQHIVDFAQRLPKLTWQPTEIDPDRRRSIDAYVAGSALTNIARAMDLNACVPGWGANYSGQSLIVLVNLLHLISDGEARTLIREAARALAPGGRFVIYGPFMRDGALTSDGDERFHNSLKASDPEIGYKDDFDILDTCVEAGLDIVDVVEMPSNNLALVTGRS